MMPRLHAFAESNGGLWILAASPGIWSLHFLICYGTAATLCGRVGGGDLRPVRLTILGMTALALLLIAAVSVVAYSWHRAAGEAPPHDDDTPEDRRGFMGLATLMLSGLSAVGVVFSAMTILFIRSCT